MKPGKYYVSAVMDRDLGGIDFSASPGNVYSKAVQMELDPDDQRAVVELKLDQVYKAREFKETDTVKLVDIESKLLTKFHGKPMRLRAGVVLPPSFAKEPETEVPGRLRDPRLRRQPLRRAAAAVSGRRGTSPASR